MAHSKIDVAVNEYLFVRLKRVLGAIKPILSEQMFKETLSLPDDTPVRISTRKQNVYVKTITLGEWRTLFVETYHNSDG